MTIRRLDGYFVYVLFRRSAPFYVGQSKRIFARIQEHIDSGLLFDSVRVMRVDDLSSALKLERKKMHEMHTTVECGGWNIRR